MFDFDINDRVQIVDTHDIWEGKKGTVISIDEDIVTVSVDFVNDKKVIQTFPVNKLVKEDALDKYTYFEED